MTSQQGIIKFVLIIIVAIVALGYFGFNLRDIMQSPGVQANLSYAWQICLDAWNGWLKEPVVWFWTNIWVPYIWEPFVRVMESMKDTAPTDQVPAPKV